MEGWTKCGKSHTMAHKVTPIEQKAGWWLPKTGERDIRFFLIGNLVVVTVVQLFKYIKKKLN